MHTTYFSKNAPVCRNIFYNAVKYVGTLDSFAMHLVLNVLKIFSG
jgi:hypothetical protein